MVAEGCARLHRNDTLDDILAAPDRQELLDWLRSREMLHVEGDYVLVHAGLLPSWSVSKALGLARIVEDNLRGTNFHEFCMNMYGDQPDRWSDALEGYERLRVIINAMTRMRVCTRDGKMDFSHKGPAQGYPARLSAMVRGAWTGQFGCDDYLWPLVCAGPAAPGKPHRPGYGLPLGR